MTPAAIWAIALPWPADSDLGFVLPVPVLAVMALSGAGILLLAGGQSSAGLRATMAILGLTLLAYPCLLAMSAASRGGPLVAGAAFAGHLIPLTMVSVIPVLAVSVVTARSRRGWIAAILLVTAVTTVVDITGVRVLTVLASVVRMSGFVLPIAATWPLVRNTAADMRRRAIVCGMASVVPVLVIMLCAMLGFAEDALGIGGAAVSVLMLGLTGCAVAIAGLTWGATRQRPTWLMRRSAILWMLAGVLAVVTLILAAGGVLVASAFVRAPVAMLVGVLLTGAVGLVSVRLHHWAGRLIDPRAEIETELAGLGEVSGHRRMALQQVLRKVTGDPSLSLAVRADDTWLDADGNPISPPADAVPLGRAGGDALVICSRPELSGRIARVGDWGSLLDPAVMEAVVEQEAARADRAAAAERSRISRDLHDGVQAHLLGIALNLQLSGRGLEEPGARLLVEETVVGLRDAVSQVRALAEGGAPTVLVTDGLGAALAHLVRPLDVVTQTRLPERRHSAEVEETAFFVASEAIANAVKHAGADHIEIAVEETGSVLTVIVTDDGVGGADLRLGTGLRGITERVAAFGGLLVVREARPRGTVVEASLPCG
ncbi:hypothetical protein C0Z10_04765 [Acidipropionibacterium jensenii]|uniref:histidine kinase n=1 Tax=Acidipropionibacterium jensenii TaxID=1749 RepID=A0A3T0RYJ0_9ACTN|nr:hypothetical protein C0Z10_04765 [Acidipropionibacterium jensenii]